MNIVGILLAAGAGSRFGGGKLAHPIPPDGLPLSLVAYRNLKSVLDTVIVVVRADDATVRSIFEDEGARLALCPDAREGMGRSLAAGIDAATDADGWVIALGDMPKVAPQTMARLKARTDRDLKAVRVATRPAPPRDEEPDDSSGVVETTEGLEAAQRNALRA